MIKRITAAFVALALGVALSLVGASAAQAHTGDLSATAVCQTDGTYKITYKLTISNTTEAGSTKWSIGTTSFAHTPTSNADLPGTVQPGTVASTGSGVYTLGTTTVPGTSTKAPWAYAFTTWVPDNFTKGSDGGDITLAGTCADTPDSSTITFCHYDNGQGGKYTSNTTSVSVFYQAGHLQHSQDIYPAGTYIKNGVTHTWPAQGDQSLLQWNDCLAVDAAASVSVTPATCTAAGTVSWTGLVNATGGVLDQTPGTHNAVATATANHAFPAGTGVSADGKTKTISYTIVAQLSGNNCLATASLTPTTSCTANSTQTPTVSHATLTSGALETTPGNYSATFTADSGYHFSNNSSTLVIPYTIVGPLGYQNTNPTAPCYQTVDVVPTFPTATGPTCATAGALPALPTDQTGITFSWAPDGLTMVATAQAGYSFANGTVTTHLYTTPGGATGYQNTNPDAPCYQPVAVTPSFPAPTGPTCDAAGSLPELPTGQTGITYSWAQDGLTMVATTTAGYVFPDGTVTTHTYDQPADAIGYQNSNPEAACYKLVDVAGEVNHTDQTCSVDSALVGGSITVTITDHVTYVITDSSDADVPFDGTTGKTGLLAPGTYTVAVSADTGYSLTTPSSVQVVIAPFDGDCGHVDASVSASAQKFDEQCITDGESFLVPGYIVVGITTGIDYTITNSSNDNIPFDATSGSTGGIPAGSYVVHPTAQVGFTLANPGDIPLTIAASDDARCGLPTDATVDPSAVQVQLGCSTAGSYTLSSDQVDPTAVIWTVNGSVVAQGTYTVTTPGSYHIVAAPNAPTWGFDHTIQPWDFTFTAPTTCDLKTLALTGTSPTGALVLGGFAVLFGLALLFRAERRRKTARG